MMMGKVNNFKRWNISSRYCGKEIPGRYVGNHLAEKPKAKKGYNNER